MEFLYMLEKIRMPGLNELMLAVTTLGEETAFLLIALVVFWCVDKRRGYYLLSVGFTGTILNQTLKLSFRVPRPWVLDPDFTVLEQAKAAAGGYSFPSGHTTSAVGTFGTLAATEKRKWLRWTFITLAVLVGFSRMYVGVHTPADVLAGAGTSLALVLLVKPMVYSGNEKHMKFLIAGMLALSIAFMLFVTVLPLMTQVDEHNLQSGIKNAYTMLGCLIGVAVVYVADKKWMNFTVEAPFKVQVVKVLVGLLLVLAVKEGLRAPLEAMFDGHLIARSIRYFLIVIMAGLVWPMNFKRLLRIR